MICRYLTYENRKSLEKLYKGGAALPDIAEALGVHLATVYRELIRGKTEEMTESGREGYSAELAQQTVQKSLKRRGHRENK